MMEGRSPADSHSVLANRMAITDANSAGFVHGGTVMKLCDEVAGLAAIKHSSRRVVTAGVDRMTFLDRVLVGEVITVKATVNAAWRTSMEVGVRVEAEDPLAGKARHTSSAYVTMVALDDEGVPTEVPPLVPTNEEERRRQQEAQVRRQNRLAEREQTISTRASGGARLASMDDGYRRRRSRARFRLIRGEPIPQGLRRIAREQIDMAVERLDGGTNEDHGEAVHEARKGLKRLRAVLRLARGELSDEVYRRENAAFRDAGRRLADTRDAQVLVETLNATVEDDPRAAKDTGAMRDALVSRRDELHQPSASEQSADVVSELHDAGERVGDWPLADESFAALSPGLERIYRRGRRALKVALREPTDEHLHELRKRVKDLWHATQLLRPAAPKRMKALASDLHTLSDRLGDDHDQAVLLAWARDHPEHLDETRSLTTLEDLVAARRAELQADAFGRAKAIYARKPRAFAKRVRRRWEKRAAARAAA